MHRTIRLLAVLAVAALAGPATAAAAKSKVQTLRLTTGNITVTPVDLLEPGQTSGDLYAYSGDVFRKGVKVGRFYGNHTSLGVEGDREIVQGLITFRLQDGELAAAGLAAYPLQDQSGTIIDEPFSRPIIGGTGRYDGARGTLTTVRNSNGTYSQLFRYRR
ncbi:MAG TPA: hypothetical protein VIL49_11820 [Capillimicrobium sp.]|jgi:hypothetical protein